MPPSGRPNVKGTSLLFDVFVVAHAVGEMLSDGMTKSPLTPEEYALYSHLSDVGPRTPSELAQELHAPATTVSDWVRGMMARRHARQIPNPSDRRSYVIVLTPAGRRAHASANRRFEQVNDVFLAGLTRPEAELRGCLAEILTATRRQKESGGT